MNENYLTAEQVAGKLNIGKTTFYAHLPKLMARGLKRIVIGRQVRYFESTLEKVLEKAAENESPIR